MEFQLQPQHPENSRKPRESKFIAAPFFESVKRCAADVGLARQIVLAQVEGFAAHSDLRADGG